MIKNNKGKAIISSIIILLPALLGLLIWNQLPENMASHWGGDGVTDGFAPKGFMVFGMPLILLAVHWLCLLGTELDKKGAQKNKKIVNLIYFMIPVLSLVVNGFVYSIALEKEWNMGTLIPVLIGVMFLVIGNYLPKTTRNRHMGIKLRWTVGNEENWQKTHRLGGRLWVICGAVILVSAPFSMEMVIGTMLVAIILSIVVPFVYSYRLYRKHKAAGIEYEPVFNRKTDKVALWITAIVVPLILIGVVVLMVVGDVSVDLGNDHFTVSASFSESLTIRYEDIDTVEYRESFDIGHREMGFGSPRLSTGTFKNNEFGRYTLYAYTNGEGCVILRQGDNVLVIVGKTAEETKGIYDSLASKIKASK